MPSPSLEGVGLLLDSVLRGAPGNEPLCWALWDAFSPPARKKCGLRPVPLWGNLSGEETTQCSRAQGRDQGHPSSAKPPTFTRCTLATGRSCPVPGAPGGLAEGLGTEEVWEMCGVEVPAGIRKKGTWDHGVGSACPHHDTGTVPVAVATCGSPRLSAGSFAPIQGSPPSPPPGSARGFRCRRANLFTSGDWRHLKVGRSNWHLMSQLSRGKEKQDSRQGRHLLPCAPASPPCATCTPGCVKGFLVPGQTLSLQAWGCQGGTRGCLRHLQLQFEPCPRAACLVLAA